jgi:uridylate kinase
MMKNIKIISLGGSIIAPQKVDIQFIKDFFNLIKDYLKSDFTRKLIIVCGGGGPARQYQQAYREIVPLPDSDAADWIGISATYLNAELLRHIFGDFCVQQVIKNPTANIKFKGRLLIAAGWKPGFSTDYDTVLLAEKYAASLVINLSNIARVYTADPKIDPHARPLAVISWADFKKMAGDSWTPGKNLPFDPIASAYAAKIGLKVIVAAGKDIKNLNNILLDKPFIGTVIG